MNIAKSGLKERREWRQTNGLAWPPVPKYKVAVTLPQPMDGKDGANAWTPRKN
jgi:hypothetical protein